MKLESNTEIQMESIQKSFILWNDNTETSVNEKCRQYEVSIFKGLTHSMVCEDIMEIVVEVSTANSNVAGRGLTIYWQNPQHDL